MFKFFDKFGNILFRTLQSLATLIVLLGGTAMGFFLAIFLCMGIEELTGSKLLTDIALWILLPICSIAPTYLIYYKGRLPRKKRTSNNDRLYPRSYNAYSVEKYGEFPHFGKVLGTPKVKDIVKNDSFHQYVFKDGKKASHIFVSSTDKWVRILGGYLPIDLICGYSKNNNKLYTIDGVTIKLPMAARLPFVYRELEKFFKERGAYHEDMPDGAEKEYRNSLYLGGNFTHSLSELNWAHLRYLWEKNILNNSSNYADKIATPNYVPVLDDGSINKEIFERVLSKKEINRTYELLKRGQVAISEYLDFKSYKNEFSVCNGIELLRALGHPKNLEGIDFLFDCLCDVDEAFFLMAVDLLKTYPRADREEKIEENAKLAFETGDVLKLAGVLYLSKQLDYDCKYIKQIREEQAENASVEEATKKADDAVKKFELDEQALFGSGEVQEFNPTGVAYQEQE
ncbi:hypothetical protein SAMN04487770_11931 [Butyrivibrio sp. ob235]|uniref:hypothetical protein n=1 Tax=Butyrivibrio sp. ob235 TaxID=1761780 RepID=UPI0008B40EEF|nr:hypothetical protein [Butyrivibrio sp. ob235]SEL85617.1 hypothetical protein SAMN04487770_11931 [Butyrivibrio sp. ob235]